MPINLLKTKVKGRIERILNFAPRSARYANDNYVLDTDDADQNDLLLMLLLTGDGNHISESENNLFISSIELDATTSKKDGIVLNATLGEKAIEKAPDDLADKIAISYADNEQKTYLKVGCNIKKLTLKLSLGNEQRELVFFFEKAVYHAVVDFGSEASQACWWEASLRNQRRISFVERINSSMVTKLDAKECVQYDKSDNNLYRSLNYISKAATPPTDTTPNYSASGIVKYLVLGSDATILSKKYLQIPNTKLSSFEINEGDYSLNNGTDVRSTQVPRLVLNNIVYQTLNDINSATQIIYNNDEHRAVVLYMLMPNVYPVHIVSTTLNNLATDIMQWIGTGNVFGNITGVELRYVSESDASLLGLVSEFTVRREQIDPGNYLIIDAGKGTLDYSLMEVGRDGATSFTNKSRGGTVGAGAAVTYGVLLALVNEFLCSKCDGHSEANTATKSGNIAEFIREKIVKADIANQNIIMGVVEDYKVQYNDRCDNGPVFGEKREPDDAPKRITVLKLDDFKNFISTLNGSSFTYLSAESYAYLSIELDKIVEEAVRSIKGALDKGTKANAIVFTGRGCMMHELRKRLMETLAKEGVLNNGARVILPDPGIMKTVCLDIIDLCIRGHYDTAEARQAFSPWDLIRGGNDHTENRRANLNLWERLSIRRLEAHGGTPQYTGSTVKGIDFTTGNLTHINIGGWLYDLPEEFRNKQCKLYFDGTYYNVVTKKGDLAQTLDHPQPYRPNLGYETIFPNVTAAARVKVPEIKNNSN